MRYFNYKIYFLLSFVLYINAYGQEVNQQNPSGDIELLNDSNVIVPLSTVFHNIGRNALHSFSYNYGLNFIGAAAFTWTFIETGIDWEWNRLAYNNVTMPNVGLPALYTGYVVPAIAPLSFYWVGYAIGNERLQMTGLALTQSLMLTIGIQTVLKMSTGRALTGIVTQLDHTRSNRTDDFSDEFEWFDMNFIAGWPSGHTANAFAAAATIAELYRDSPWIPIVAYSYATLVGVGVSLNVHWLSDVVAGALIGFAVGKTVGRSFNQLLEKNKEALTFSLYVTPQSVGVVFRF